MPTFELRPRPRVDRGRRPARLLRPVRRTVKFVDGHGEAFKTINPDPR